MTTTCLEEIGAPLRELRTRFEAEIEPKLPRVLRHPIALAVIVLLFHWAVVMAGLALVDDVWAATQLRTKSE